jgi:hypothetical protein
MGSISQIKKLSLREVPDLLSFTGKGQTVIQTQVFLNQDHSLLPWTVDTGGLLTCLAPEISIKKENREKQKQNRARHGGSALKSQLLRKQRKVGEL